jgi:signal peptidase I
MTLQLQQQQQWQGGAQFQTYESFSQIMHDVPNGPVIASIVIAAIPFIIYFLWKKSVLRNFFIAPVVSLSYRIWHGRKDRELEKRVQEEYEGIVGKKTEIKDILRYGSYAGMVAFGVLILKKAFFFSLVVSQSMMPTLWEADLVLVESLTTENIEVGDIIVFEPPDRYGQSVVHRVISVDDGKIKTKGDNAGIDAWTLTSENLEGKVVTFNGEPVVIKNLGTYLMPRRIYMRGSDPAYELIKDAIQKVHAYGPIILIVLLLIVLVSTFEGKRKYKAIYE